MCNAHAIRAVNIWKRGPFEGRSHLENPARFMQYRLADRPSTECNMRVITVGLISAAALAAGLLLVREARDEIQAPRARDIPAGETQPATISLDRIRELGY